MLSYRRTALLVMSLCALTFRKPLANGQDFDPGLVTRAYGYSQPPTGPTDLIDVRHQIDGEIEIILRRTKLISTKIDFTRVAIGDSSIVDAAQMEARELQLIGKTPGTTTMTLWLADPGQKRQILTYLVNVVPDPGVQNLRKTQYSELEHMIRELFPNSKVQLIPVADKLVVKGQARDSQEAAQILSIVRGQAVGFTGVPGVFGGVNQGQAAELYPDSGIPPTNIINLLRVPGETQVLLKVQVAELSRRALREMGVNFNVESGKFFLSSILAGKSNIVATFDNEEVSTFVSALETHGVLKLLAEPNLVTLSGHTASFIAGGRFAVPTVVGVGGAQAATTTFQGFGTQLTFTPNVIDKDRIRLAVAPEFSSINQSLAVNGIPGLNTRAAFTTVDMREGQVLAIAGLLSDQQTGDRARVPLLGRLPVVGAAFAAKSVSRDETELIVLVRPEIVRPMDPDEVPSLLPGTDVTEPNDVDFYLHNRLEGNPDAHYRSTIWPEYRQQVKDAKHRADRQGWIAYPASSAEPVPVVPNGGPYVLPPGFGAPPMQPHPDAVQGGMPGHSSSRPARTMEPTDASSSGIRQASGQSSQTVRANPSSQGREKYYVSGPSGYSK